MGEFSKDIDSLVDENESREELERQLLDNNYMKEKHEQARMNDSMYSDRSDTSSVKAITFGETSKSNIYKPAITYKPVSDGYNEPIKAFSHDSSFDQHEPVEELLKNSTLLKFETKQNLEPVKSETVEGIESSIARQIELFHKIKNECLDDCSDFMKEFESKTDEEGNKLISIPEDFDDIVDIAVDEQEEAMAIGNGQEELLDENGKPFWMRYFKADYLGESNPEYQNMLLKAGVITDENAKEESKFDKKNMAKFQEELMKIKSLDKQLVNSNKLYKGMKQKSMMRDQEIKDRRDREDEQKKQELEKKKKSYIKSNTAKRTSSRGSTRSKQSENSKISTKSRKDSAKGFNANPFSGMARPSSGANKAIKKAPKVPEEDKSNTFLTGVNPGTNKMSELDQRIKKDLDIDIRNEDDENRKQSNYELDMINAYEETLKQSTGRRKKYFNDDSSENSYRSDHSQEQEFDFIKENVNRISEGHHKSYLNKLTANQRRRLDELENDIDNSFLGNEDISKKILALKDKKDKEKLELMSAIVPLSEAGQTNMSFGMKNAYVYEDADRIEKINDELKTKFLSLPSPDDDISQSHDDVTSVGNFQTSVMGERQKSAKDYDVFSERSQQLTQISKRSGITNFSHSIISKLSKPVSLPKEKLLRENAESKLLKRNLAEIDDCLSQTKNSNIDQRLNEDQMSRLVDECRRDNERAQMLEVDEDEENSDYEGPSQSSSSKNYSRKYELDSSSPSKALVLYQDENTKLSEAEHLLRHLIDQKEAFERGDPLPLEYGDEADEYNEVISNIEADIEKHKSLNKEENELTKRLKEQEDYLAQIMKEIEEKEKMLKDVIIENEKYLEDEYKLENQEMSARSAATKFSSMRGNILRSDKVVNSAVPADKVIEEVPEEEDEENDKLEEILKGAQNFNIQYEIDQSSHNYKEENEKPLYILLGEAKTEEEKQRIMDEHYPEPDITDDLIDPAEHGYLQSDFDETDPSQYQNTYENVESSYPDYQEEEDIAD